jgi:long-chain acyl-CoA synthetase
MLSNLGKCAALAIALTLPYNVVADASHGNLAQMILSTVDALPTKEALKFKHGEGWKSYTYKEWESRSLKLAAWMLEQGVQKGDRIAILCFNRPEWAIVDLAGHMVGATVVPMYPSLTGPQHNYILNDAAIKVWFVMDRVHLEPVRKLAGALDKVKVVGIADPSTWPPASKEKMKEAGFSEAPKEWPEGTQLLTAIMDGPEASAAAVGQIKERIRSVGQDDLATICYTSGTTSAPPSNEGTMVYAGKGVMLTHKNLISNVDAVSSAVQLGPKDTFLSILPLAHMFERTCGYYSPVARGGTIAYAVSPASFIDDMGEVKPTVFACVPLLFERMYQKVMAVGDKKPVKGAMGAITNVADFFGADPEKVSGFLDAKKMRLLGKMLRGKTGGKLRFAVSGGAALSKDLAEFFLSDAKILILEGYGLTETSPVLTCNRPDAYRFGTIGKPVKGVELKIAEDGEILARGDMVMKGYLNNPEETAKAIDDQGWFHTGDLGAIEQDGFVKITGRKKSLFKLSTGKYIAPEKTENKLVHELIAQAVVVGENQKHAGCLIFPNLPAMKSLAKSLGVSGDDAALCKDAKVRSAYEKLIKDACAEMPDWEKVKVFSLLPVVLTIDSGELTPTLKVKRGVVSVKFKAEIDAMFAE